MTMATPEVLEREIAPTLPAAGGGTVDVQVATAKAYPRSIATFTRRATEMATLTPDIAASCVYALPRDGRTIEGPSARLAEICASAWGNLRIQAGTTGEDERFITGRGEAWDVETNVAIGFEVRRRITNRKGETYNDDMITVTGNAAASIALRNAVFKAIPAAFWKPIYAKCRQVIAGDIKTFAVRRDEMLKLFAVMGVTEQRLCGAIGVKGKADITIDHMVTLTGFYTALKDGDTTIEEAFPEGGGLGSPQPAQRKSHQAATGSASPAADAQATAQTAAAAAEPATDGASAHAKNIGKIKAVHKRDLGALVELETGFVAATKDKVMVAAAEGLKGSGRVVELVTRPSSNPSKYAPTLEEIQPMEDTAS